MGAILAYTGYEDLCGKPRSGARRWQLWHYWHYALFEAADKQRKLYHAMARLRRERVGQMVLLGKARKFKKLRRKQHGKAKAGRNQAPHLVRTYGA